MIWCVYELHSYGCIICIYRTRKRSGLALMSGSLLENEIPFKNDDMNSSFFLIGQCSFIHMQYICNKNV